MHWLFYFTSSFDRYGSLLYVWHGMVWYGLKQEEGPTNQAIAYGTGTRAYHMRRHDIHL